MKIILFLLSFCLVFILFENKVYPDTTPLKKPIFILSAVNNKPSEIYTVTAYDLSVQSCGKYSSHPAYGVSRSGYSLKNHSRLSAMAIAVDPKKIPLYSKVLIEFFDDNMKKYNGVYTAYDTGGAINGNRIDIFFGDFKNNVSKEALEFGVRKAKITIL